MAKKKIQPNKVQKFNCSKCGELLAKIYPWAGLYWPKEVDPGQFCNKCKNGTENKRQS